MIRKLIQGIGISTLFIVLPTLGNSAILRAPQMWILLMIGVLASVLQPSYNPFSIFARPGDKRTGARIIWSVYACQIAAILESAYLRYPRSVEWDPIATGALVTISLGLSLRTWAVLTLGRLFTMHLSVEKDHSIVRKGPYNIIRHPGYLGAFMLFLSTTVFLHAWFSAIAAALILPYAFLKRIRHEEELLKEKFGEEYESYCANVRKLIPGIW